MGVGRQMTEPNRVDRKQAEMTNKLNKPLTRIRVLDLTHMLSGPYGSMILADLGAETIKVEPLQGESTRKLLANDRKNSLDGMGAYYITLNRNKKSVALDLKHPEGLAVFHDLVREADVVISNFGVGVPERLKIDYATLKSINPRIITCTVTGFGSDGPKPDRPAFDQVAQATGGGMSITGSDPEHPVRSGIPIGDLGGGMFAVMGILAALLERERSGEGQNVDISMLDCQISMLNYMATMYFLSGENPHPIGNSHFVHVPYNTFHTSDGFIVIAVITDNFWQNLKQVVNCPEFDDPKYDGQPGRWEDREMINRAPERNSWHQHFCLLAATTGRKAHSLRAGQPFQPGPGRSAGAAPQHGGRAEAPWRQVHPGAGQSDQAVAHQRGELHRGTGHWPGYRPRAVRHFGLRCLAHCRTEKQGSGRLMSMSETRTAVINDVGPRDGLQNQTKILAPAERVRLVRALLAAGVKQVEVGCFCLAEGRSGNGGRG